jgi:anti-sigma28 factor (negative regulator of flagellin synthesis)
VKERVQTVMKIEDSYNHAVPASPARVEQQAIRPRKPNSEQGNEHIASGGVLSSAAYVSTTLALDQSERSARVAALRAQYSEGSYESDSAAISRSLVSAALNEQ